MQPDMEFVEPRGTQEVAARLAHLLGSAPAELPALVPFEPASAPPPQVAAVDGSSVVLAESGDVLLGAYRAGWVGVADGRPLRAGPMAPQIVLLTRDEGGETLRRRLAEAGVPDPQVPRMPPGALLDHLRTLEELLTALDALENLHEGDLLLVDGALQARPQVPLMDRLCARASERGVDVVGVCKSTSITLGAVPALAACQIAGRGFASATWFAPLPTPVYVRGRSLAARLSCGEERVFRFDVHCRDGNHARVLASIAALAGHPAYPGYPSPLAMAHNAVLLDESLRRRLRGEVQEASVRAGVREGAWDAAFFDYHDILELGA